MVIHNNKEVLKHWNDVNVESMYDKHLIGIEIELINSRLTEGTKILDAGCGEGEGTLVYSKNKNVEIHAVDFSETRLQKAKERLINQNNVKLTQVDFLSEYELDYDYDFIISQRFLINLMELELQQQVILDLTKRLKKGGKFLMLEGSKNGVNQLNQFRSTLGLEPIPIKWHNLFFDDEHLEYFLFSHGLKIVEIDGLGEYFFMTRAIRPYFDKELNWNSKFNEISSKKETKNQINFKDKFSRLKLWVIEKQ